MSKSVCDEEFLDAGKKDGICIWRIEDFKLIRLKLAEYGKSILFLIKLQLPGTDSYEILIGNKVLSNLGIS